MQQKQQIDPADNPRPFRPTERTWFIRALGFLWLVVLVLVALRG
ncbi:hypothetical protein [Calidithermus timidus]|jgi:hypothetical protein|nr:hypothetical protein [Calidithermus timidus]